MRVLITGAGGQLGTDLALHCSAAGDEVTAAARAELDITDRDDVLSAISTLSPHVVFNCAAWTAVDACESDPDRAFRDNALAVRWVADGCRRFGAHLVHVSTDYVFDGTKDCAYHEWDEPNPQSAYGASKLAGEREAAAHVPGATVARTSWVMGAHGSNMVKTVLALRDRDELRFVDDQRGCPTFTADLAAALRRFGASRIPGLFHVTNQGAVTWFELVREILELAGADPGKVQPIATADLDPPRPAPRPANSVLGDFALRGSSLPLLPHYRESLQATLRALLA